MPKQPTAKQLAARKAASERMKARHAAKRAEKQQLNPVEDAAPESSQPQEQRTAQADGAQQVPQPDFSSQPETTVSDNNDTQELIRLVIEMMKQNNGQVPQTAQPAVQNGKLTGTTEKYSNDVSRYPDPTERLANEPRLARFAFPINYELKFSVAPIRYQTIDNIWMTEPKFKLDLIAKMIDQLTGEDTGKRYRLTSMVFFEDPETAMIIANEQGLPVDEDNEIDFLNEMRYLRMRDWLLGAFYPQPVQTKADTQQDVVDNRVVDIYTESHVEGEGNGVKIPFDKLTRFKV